MEVPCHAVLLSDAAIDALIAEDVPYGDLTTHVLGIGSRRGRIVFRARTPLVISGIATAMRIFERVGASAGQAPSTGSMLSPGDLILEAEGPAEALFAGWKIAQTLIEWASGVATSVCEIVTAARRVNSSVVVACTRKTVPFTRALAVEAALAGGGVMHRMGLSETILVFPEHRAFLESSSDLAEPFRKLRATAPERSIVAEVLSPEEAIRVGAWVDVLQLEKFTPADIKRVAERVRKREDGRPVIAAAGGINAANAGEYACAGAEVLVTSAPWYARPAEVQVSISASVL